MTNVFVPADRQAIRDRIAKLTPESARLWGKMTAPQALAHCTLGLESATGDRPGKQKLLGKILTPFIRSMIFGEKPFSKNSPTDPTFIVADVRELDIERKRLTATIERFASQGPDSASRYPHLFFGRLSGDEWGILMYKHLDHHLRQFGV